MHDFFFFFYMTGNADLQQQAVKSLVSTISVGQNMNDFNLPLFCFSAFWHLSPTIA